MVIYESQSGTIFLNEVEYFIWFKTNSHFLIKEFATKECKLGKIPVVAFIHAWCTKLLNWINSNETFKSKLEYSYCELSVNFNYKEIRFLGGKLIFQIWRVNNNLFSRHDYSEINNILQTKFKIFIFLWHWRNRQWRKKLGLMYEQPFQSGFV